MPSEQKSQIKSLASPHTPRQIFHGKLNLQQQKKRAKELFRQLQQNQPQALKRFQLHPRAAELTTAPASEQPFHLSHCQLVIARENGFNSWPAMKTHIDSLSLQPHQLDTPATLHIRCGHDLQHGLQLAGFQGDYLAFYDPFCQGPVSDLPLEQLICLRSQFAAETYSLTLADATSRARQAYDQLYQCRSDQHPRWDKIVLWFEHDSYDQLILAFLLSYFQRYNVSLPLELICVDQAPGVSDFIGLGQLSPELFRYLWEHQRQPVSQTQLNSGEQVWQALCADTPEPLEQLIHQDVPELPFMARALQRHLAELPDPQTGLSLTQTLALEILSAETSWQAVWLLYARSGTPALAG